MERYVFFDPTRIPPGLHVMGIPTAEGLVVDGNHLSRVRCRNRVPQGCPSVGRVRPRGPRQAVAPTGSGERRNSKGRGAMTLADTALKTFPHVTSAIPAVQ